MTTKQMKQAILAKNATSPEGQLSTGIYLKKIGSKYVTILDTWESTNTYRINIGDFYYQYCS